MVITLLSNWISKKEAVGYGDVKLISVLGLFFGWRSIIMVSILSFVIAAIVSLVLLLIKKKKCERIYRIWTIYCYFSINYNIYAS